MSEPIQLKGTKPDDLRIDRARVGISYSGGGPLVLVELRCARAFIRKGIVPHAIAGVSAGALAGAAHALDVERGTGIDMAIKAISRISMSMVGLTWPRVLTRIARSLVTTLKLPPSLGDHASLIGQINAALDNSFQLPAATIGAFTDPNARPRRARLLVAATDRIHGHSVWFPASSALSDALVASSAIPGVFPWRTMPVDGNLTVLVDGAVIINQPLSKLVLTEGCGTILACAVGYFGQDLPQPTDALDNTWQSVNLMSHQSSKLEEDYVRVKMDDRGVVHHIHPQVDRPPATFDFTPELVNAVVNQACQKTEAWLDQKKQEVQQKGMTPHVPGEPLSWLAEQWDDDIEQ